LEVSKVEKVWKDWEAFASYAFNKSHATCYAYLAYQTAYLKAHYPAEFMAANLGRNLSDIKKITHLIAETKRMGISVLRPDVNESSASFTVTKVVLFDLAWLPLKELVKLLLIRLLPKEKRIISSLVFLIL